MNRGSTRCHGLIAETGERCRKYTSDSTGFCPQHRQVKSELTEFAILKCSDCPVRDCGYRNKGPSGLCYFEMTNETKDFDDKLKLIQAMRDVLRTEYLMKGRLERELSRKTFDHFGDDDDNTQTLLKEMQSVSNSLASHLERFGKFMGWDKKATSDNAQKEKVKHMMKIMNKEHKDKDKEEKTEALIKEVIVQQPEV